MIKGLIRPQLAEAGKIKIGGLGEERKKRSGDGTYRLPVKYDYFVITHTHRDQGDNLVLDQEMMDALPKGPDGKIREIPIVVHSDEIEEVFPSTLAWYNGRKLGCRGDGETATRWTFDGKGNRTDQTTEMECPCDLLEKGLCKPHATFHCSIFVPGRAVAGAVHRWRTTSLISIQRMIASLEQIKSLVGVLRGLPLVLKIEPIQVTPDGVGSSTVYCCHVELRAHDLKAVQHQALEAMQMRKALGSGDVSGYARMIESPASDDEDDEEQAFVQMEFHSEVEQEEEQDTDGLAGRLDQEEPTDRELVDRAKARKKSRDDLEVEAKELLDWQLEASILDAAKHKQGVNWIKSKRTSFDKLEAKVQAWKALQARSGHWYWGEVGELADSETIGEFALDAIEARAKELEISFLEIQQFMVATWKEEGGGSDIEFDELVNFPGQLIEKVVDFIDGYETEPVAG